MPITNITQARDTIIDILRTVIEAEATPPTLLFDGKKGDIPSTGSTWVRIQVRHNVAFQATVGGEVGGRRFRKLGIVTTQLFTPFDDDLIENDRLSQVIKNAYEGQSDNNDTIEFRNVRINEVGQDGDWYQTNILADFEYDEVR